ncbi:MAG: DUF1080 domain-containing protein [Planctomycetaceae bacterium]|nr:DUF1080 domain-containing protein [Planctomycetaceae bacterium]
MNRTLFHICLLYLAGLFPINLQADELSLADLIETTEPACVRIDVNYKDGSQGIGSGFVVDVERKWIVTNYHVVGDSESAVVTFADKTTAKVLGWNAHYTAFDLALLKIETNKKLTALPVAISLPRKGDKTIAIGAPRGLSFTASEGIVSGIRKGEELKEFAPGLSGTWLQTSTPISPGSSGGPLLNFKGEVVGVNSSTLLGSQNLNFAISCEQINHLVKVGKRVRLRELALLTPTSEAKGIPKPGKPAASEAIVIKIPSERRFRHRYKIEKDEDEFDQLTWLRTDWLKVKFEDRSLSSLGIRVTLAHDDKDKTALIAIWEVGATGRSRTFGTTASRRFQLAGGGESYELPPPKYDPATNGNVISEVMTSITGLDVFAELVLTDDLKARVGVVEMEFGRNELECLRELASIIPTGDLVEGAIRVERLKPEEDPTSPHFGKPAPESIANSLFNGKDLTGWHLDVPEGDPNPENKPTFFVRDGQLVTLGYPRGFLISDQQYENYRLEFEYRFAGKSGASGLAVHVSKLRSLYKRYPQSIEVQMNSGNAGDLWLCGEDIVVPNMVERRGPKATWGVTEGKSRRILNLTDNSEKPTGEWNTMIVECVGDEIKVWVNDDLVNHGMNCTAKKGQIALQAEGTEVEFRDLELTPITNLSE